MVVIVKVSKAIKVSELLNHLKENGIPVISVTGVGTTDISWESFVKIKDGVNEQIVKGLIDAFPETTEKPTTEQKNTAKNSIDILISQIKD